MLQTWDVHESSDAFNMREVDQNDGLSIQVNVQDLGRGKRIRKPSAKSEKEESAAVQAARRRRWCSLG